MRRKITIPADGEEIQVSMTGITVIIEFCEIYETPEDVPTIGFDSGTEKNPIYPRNQYEYQHGCFQNLVIQGTTASEGDSVWLVTKKECLGTKFQPQFSSNYKAKAGNTINRSFAGVSNVVQNLTIAELMDDDGNIPVSVYIASAGGDINYRWNDGDGSNPAPGSDADFVFVSGDKPIEFQGEDFFGTKLKFVNAVTDEEPELVVEPRYYSA